MMGRQSPEPAPDAAPHIQRRATESARLLSTRVHPGETTAHSHDTSVPTEYRLVVSARGHDGTVTSVTSAKMPAPITTPTFTAMVKTTPTKHPPSCNGYNHE
jgi:hypothetical protein